MRAALFNLKLSITILLSLLFSNSQSQNHYTPYDDVPGVIKSYKPVLNAAMPEWAFDLYKYPVNYNVLNDNYNSFMQKHPDNKDAIRRYYKIWSLAIKPFVLDNGSIELPDFQDYYSNLRSSQLSSRSVSQSNNSDWTLLGPLETFLLNEQNPAYTPPACPWQVNIYSFDVAPSDHNVLYCGSETGIMNKSTDKGLNWQQIAINYPFGGGITAIAIHPFDPNIIYAAGGWQIHKTIDGGNTWQPMLPNYNMFYAQRLKIDPSNPEKIIAASDNGLFISTNGGNDWSQKSPYPCWDIDIKPDANEVIFGLVRLNENFSVIISSDGGNTFTPEPDFPAGIGEFSGGLLATTPANPNVIFAIMLSDNGPYLAKGNYIQNNWTWSVIATGSTSQFPMDNGQGYFDLILEVSPLNEDQILAGTTSLYKSTDGGNSFECVGGYCSGLMIHPDIQDAKILADGDTWISTDGGMNLTTDFFTTQNNNHSRSNGLVGSHMWGFDQGWNEDLVVGGRYHNGNTAIADFYQPKAIRMGGAESPTGWILQGKSRHAAFDDLGEGFILPSTPEGMPEGRFYFTKYPNMDEYGGLRGNLFHHVNYSGTLYLGEGNSFWRSVDFGITYQLLYTFPGRVKYTQTSMSNPEVFYADISGFGLYRTSDGGLSWSHLPSLTNGTYGTPYWNGRLFFCISPYNEDVIYACLQNGSWSADLGQVYKSVNGGNTWENWSGSLTNKYLKCLVIQPTLDSTDLVYLFTHNGNGTPAEVFYRKHEMNDWSEYFNGYPVGMQVNLALPFYRDSKIRVAGTASIWESPFQEPDFTPIINPWVGKKNYNCMYDTIRFEDHSIINHENVSWHWEISPAPLYINNPNIRNPLVVTGNPDSYSVTLTVTKNGQSWSKTISDMFTTTTCPSIDDCDNPAEVPKDIWSLLYVDSQQPGSEATRSFDDDLTTGWHTMWYPWTDPYPHEIQVNMGRTYNIFKFIYSNSSHGWNGRIKDYELYLSNDSLPTGINWGEPVMVGQFVNTISPQYCEFNDPILAKYFKLKALSEVNGGPWSSAFEFGFVGCTDIYLDDRIYHDQNIDAYPIPTSGILNVNVPSNRQYFYHVISSTGIIMEHGNIASEGKVVFDLSSYKKGVYLIKMQDQKGVNFIIKTIKN